MSDPDRSEDINVDFPALFGPTITVKRLKGTLKLLNPRNPRKVSRLSTTGSCLIPCYLVGMVRFDDAVLSCRREE
jgi:hypothetical protein